MQRHGWVNRAVSYALMQTSLLDWYPEGLNYKMAWKYSILLSVVVMALNSLLRETEKDPSNAKLPFAFLRNQLNDTLL